MDRQELADLTEAYQVALIEEMRAQRDATQAAVEAERVKGQAIAEGYASEAITGSNAQKRSASEAAYLAAHTGYQSRRDLAERAEYRAKYATVTRKTRETEIGLVKAWLYSQAHIG